MGQSHLRLLPWGMFRCFNLYHDYTVGTVCVWLVCIDALDFICEKVYIPLCSFRCYNWNKIKIESIFLHVFF